MMPARTNRNMKNSGIEWVGNIPDHWNVLPFYSFADEVVHKNSGLKERNLLSLSYGRLVRKDMDRLEGLTPASFEGYNVIEPNDIVFRLTDLQNDQTSLRSARAPERGIITSAYVTVRPHSSPRFFEYLMRSYDTTKVFYGIGGGIRQSMKFADLKRLPVVVPPVSEMEEISSYLDHAITRLDALVAKKTRFIELLREKREALITHAVTKGLNAGVPMKDSGVEWLGKVPADWQVLSLKRDIDFLTSGSRGWAQHYSESGPIFLRIGNLKRGDFRLDLSDVQRVTPPHGAEGERTKVRPNDLLFSITAYLGSVGIAPDDLGEAFVSQHVALVRLKKRLLLPAWAAYVAISWIGRTYLTSQGYGGTKVQLGLNDIADMPMTVPSAPEQKAIVATLDRATTRIDTLITKTEHSIELLREHRTALITAAVTGKIDLSNAA